MGPITRTAALAIIFEVSIVLPVAGTEEFADTPPPLAIQIGEHGAADFVNLIFLFDRVATQSSSVTSPDYRERISQPSSPFYPRLSGIPKRPNRSQRTGSYTAT